MRRGRRLPLEALEPYLWTPAEPPHPVAWTELFNNDRPVEIEIGFGKGAFLIAASEIHPDKNFLGIEVDRGLQLYVATRLAKRNRRNVRLVRGDARLLLRDYIATASVQAIHVYFPDPWWKRRHKKRRLFTPEFVQECGRVLVPGGLLLVATDVKEYFVEIEDLMMSAGQFQRLPPEALGDASLFVGETNFERKARLQGRPVFRAIFRKDAGFKPPTAPAPRG